MGGLEIAIIIIGAICLLVSFLLPGKKEAAGEELPSGELEQVMRRMQENSALQEEELEKKVQAILEKSSAQLVSEAEEDMNRLSNEKIMAIDEFSNQILAKIENNNQEVVFLYDMFQRKEEEMKSAMNKLEQSRRENKELLERLEEVQKGKGMEESRPTGYKEQTDRTDGLFEASDRRNEESEPEENEEINQQYRTQAERLPEMVNEMKAADAEATGSNDTGERERKERVLELYRKDYSIKEISKELSMGQGEVKLIVDLYGKAGR